MTKILLVEDNEMNRDMLSRRLKRRGFEVIIAVDGAIGVTLAQSEQPDLILMDMSLPVLDGWEATKKIKAMPQTASIPVIALTAHAMVGDREKTLQAGCDDYDTKPVDLKRLLKKIDGLLEAVPQRSGPPDKESHPLIPAPVSESSISKVTSPKVNNDDISILVVDDNEMNREVLGRRLRKVGYLIHFAESGEAALETLEQETISLVLLDVMMPGIGGWETLRRIRLELTATELPVIMVTAKDQSEDVVKAFGLGANDYITKPIDFPITLARVQSQLQLLKSSPSKQNADLSPEKEQVNPVGDRSPQSTSKVLINKEISVSINDTQTASPTEKKHLTLLQVLTHENETGEPQSNSSVLLNNQYKIFEQIYKTDYHQSFLAYDTHQRKETVVGIQRIPLPYSDLNPLIQSKIQEEIDRFGVIFTRQTPNMIRLLNAFARGNHIYVVQEYVEGSLLSAEIQSGRPHTPLYAINVLGRLLEILSIIHDNNCTLQQFSTSSFTRRKRDGEIILTDFGISERLNLIVAQDNDIDGLDMSPRKSSSSINFADDLYLVGCIAIQALTGVYPKQYDGIHAKKRLEWQTVFDVNSKCAAYINRLIHPDENERFIDATQAHHELLKSHLLLHAVQHNMVQRGKIL